MGGHARELFTEQGETNRRPKRQIRADSGEVASAGLTPNSKVRTSNGPMRRLDERPGITRRRMDHSVVATEFEDTGVERNCQSVVGRNVSAGDALQISASSQETDHDRKPLSKGAARARA